MDKHPIGDLTEITLSKIKELVDVNTVVGDPINTPDGIMLIPVSRVMMGYGIGGGDGTMNNSALGSGAGSGAGVKIDPVGFLCIQDGSVRMINIASPATTTLDRVIDAAPELIDKGEQLYYKFKNKP